MKKILIMLCVTLCALSLAACGVKGIDVSELEKSPYNAADQSSDVTMTMEKPSVSTDTETLNIHFTNRSEKEYTFGMEPHLDVEANGVWYVVPTLTDAMWIEIAYQLPSGEGADVEFPLSSFYGNLPAGNYRIVKPLYSDAESTFAVAVFKIE